MMSSGLRKLAGSALLAACAFLTPAGEADAGAVNCIEGPGGNNTTSINLVIDGCVASKNDPFDVYTSNDKEVAVENAIRVATGVAVDISLYGKYEAGVDSSLFEITPITTKDGGGILTGEWRILDPNVFVKYITIKAANSYILYELAGGGANSGTFSTAALVNGGGKTPGLSHISFWLAPRTTEVPEPAPLALLGVGLAGLGFAGRRRRA
ncbi:PEP-CTERM sorting domain-containing protein [Pedomonas sp. V897]|uniref:PEP-CTERM sorting domain-containing protein n=1 Tax=Pedomonas sp. V897 TaxID=3446482 RepID=UPI003EE1531E